MEEEGLRDRNKLSLLRCVKNRHPKQVLGKRGIAVLKAMESGFNPDVIDALYPDNLEGGT